MIIRKKVLVENRSMDYLPPPMEKPDLKQISKRSISTRPYLHGKSPNKRLEFKPEYKTRTLDQLIDEFNLSTKDLPKTALIEELLNQAIEAKNMRNLSVDDLNKNDWEEVGKNKILILHMIVRLTRKCDKYVHETFITESDRQKRVDL